MTADTELAWCDACTPSVLCAATEDVQLGTSSYSLVMSDGNPIYLSALRMLPINLFPQWQSIQLTCSVSAAYLSMVVD